MFERLLNTMSHSNKMQIEKNIKHRITIIRITLYNPFLLTWYETTKAIWKINCSLKPTSLTSKQVLKMFPRPALIHLEITAITVSLSRLGVLYRYMSNHNYVKKSYTSDNNFQNDCTSPKSKYCEVSIIHREPIT